MAPVSARPTGAPPSDATILDALNRYEAAGYTGQFAARPGAKIECFTCRKVYPARSIRLDEASRLEGTSDPSDEMVVAALRCVCGAKGTVVFTYGPSAPPEDHEAFRALRDERGG